MKRIAIALLVTAAALAANSARADTRVSVGINVGTPVYGPAPRVVVAPAPNYYPPAVPVYNAPARGYWKDVTVKTWVPERWVMSRNRWGRPVRVSEPGYFTYRTERVWVDSRHDNGRHYGHDNRNTHGYDNRNTYGNDNRNTHGNDNRYGWNR